MEAWPLLRRGHRAAKGDPPAVVRRGRPRRTVLGDGEERAFSLRAANHLCKWYCECGFTLNGGSDVRILNFTAIGCHGNLQSAGHASWPLYCGARHCSCALLSGTRSCGTCSSSSSSAPIRSRSGKKSCWLVRPLMRAWSSSQGGDLAGPPGRPCVPAGYPNAPGRLQGCGACWRVRFERGTVPSMPEQVDLPPMTPHEEREWRAEFKSLGREMVREQRKHWRPLRSRDLAVVWLREQEKCARLCFGLNKAAVTVSAG